MAATALAEPDTHSDESFNRLYREHAPTVYRYALGTVGNPADAEDVAQATFASAFQALRRGLRPAKPENWLISIAHNECRQRFRRLGRRAPEVPLDSEVATREADVEDAAETSETIDGVLDALAELPFNQRAALVLREVSGRSASEIAECLGTSSAAVDMLVFRARQTIRTNLAGVRAIALVPLPRSLLSFAGGSAGTAGGLAAGFGAAVKLAAVAVGAVAVATSGGSATAEPGSGRTELRVVPKGAVAAALQRAPVHATSASARKSRERVPAKQADTSARGAGEAGLAPSASLPSAPLQLPSVEVSPSTVVSLPPVLSEPVAKQAKVSLPTVPQLPPGLPEDLTDVPAPVTEGIPNPGITLPDAGDGTLP